MIITVHVVKKKHEVVKHMIEIIEILHEHRLKNKVKVT